MSRLYNTPIRALGTWRMRSEQKTKQLRKEQQEWEDKNPRPKKKKTRAYA